ncbi:hypothetical protein [Tellurirhabdus bombi]|uniref:hypothetical protein n=1 Tax=Tellurirhabdus bombi TaxID=2907205 RepID=UPI001F328BB0|nr:hypothetical protein [Tellurirhabdus bombi]
MKGNLERFIRDNREDFDVLEPRADLWGAIEQGMGHKPQRRWLNSRSSASWSTRAVWQVAASVVLLIGLAAGFMYFNNQYGFTKQPEMVALAPAYAGQFKQYVRLIDEKRIELQNLTASNPALYKEFATELTELEKNYTNLKKDLPKAPNQEALIQAMVQNLQLQIDMLNQQLMIIQRIKQQTNEPKKALI